jgi:hypothetical protein
VSRFVIKTRVKLNSTGATILPVIVLSSAILILLTTLLRSYTSSNSRFVRQVDRIVALSNARNGIYASLIVRNAPTIEKPIDVFDTTEFMDSTTDEFLFSPGEKLGGAVVIFGSNLFTQSLRSTGYKDRDTSVITAEIGSRYKLTDTTLLLCRTTPPQLSGNLSGEVLLLANDSLPEALPLNLDGLSKVKEIFDSLFIRGDSLDESPPLVINYSDQLNAASDTINSPLFFDAGGGFLDINAKGREFFILGDFQITGEVTVTGGEFIVGGEFRLNDKSKFIGSTIICKERVFIADESSFSGKIVAGDIIEIYGNSSVKEKTLLIAFEKNLKAPKQTTPVDKDVSAPTKMFGINIRDFATVDGSLVALGKKGGIRTFVDTKSSGILWSRSRVVHGGEHSGLIRAVTLGNESGNSSNSGEKAILDAMSGSLEISDERVSYELPWFIGVEELIEWGE